METMSVDEFIARVLSHCPDSTFSGLADHEIAELEARFGAIPEPVKEFFKRVCYSGVGDLTFVGVRNAGDILPVEYTGPDPDYLILAMDDNSECFAVRPSTGWEMGEVGHDSAAFEPCAEGLLALLINRYFTEYIPAPKPVSLYESGRDRFITKYMIPLFSEWKAAGKDRDWAIQRSQSMHDGTIPNGDLVVAWNLAGAERTNP